MGKPAAAWEAYGILKAMARGGVLARPGDGSHELAFALLVTFRFLVVVVWR